MTPFEWLATTVLVAMLAILWRVMRLISTSLWIHRSMLEATAQLANQERQLLLRLEPETARVLEDLYGEVYAIRDRVFYIAVSHGYNPNVEEPPPWWSPDDEITR